MSVKHNRNTAWVHTHARTHTSQFQDLAGINLSLDPWSKEVSSSRYQVVILLFLLLVVSVELSWELIFHSLPGGSRWSSDFPIRIMPAGPARPPPSPSSSKT